MRIECSDWAEKVGGAIINLLVTNTRNAQAYAVIRALRPYARRIVATIYGKNRLAARLSHAATSRLVDARYRVPSPVEDWRTGNIQKDNTPREEAYVQAILEICESERIDTIFPSWDPHVYVFSKNKPRFERRGILIPIPDYETVIVPLDKYRTIRAAQAVGFPCPKTHLPEDDDHLREIAHETGFPLVIKPRFGSAGRGMTVVNDLAELSQKTRLIRETHGMPMIQEYIPGAERQNLYLMLDQLGDVKVAFCSTVHRYLFRLHQNFSTAYESSPPHRHVRHATRLVQSLGWWGSAIVQTKIDPRDGLPKLMEVNPRLGFEAWVRIELGINEPLLSLKIARGEAVQPVSEYPVGTMLLCPVADVLWLGFRLLDLLVHRFRVGIQGKAPIDPLNPPLTIREIVESIKRTYLRHHRRVYGPYFKHFFQDPIVSVLWWLQCLTMLVRGRAQLGR